MYLRIMSLISAFALNLSVGYSQCNNVVENGDASAGLTGWTFSSGAGATWANPNNTYGPAFKASYNWCTMNQTIDLWGEGYSAQYLDNQQPEISFMQFYKGAASNYADKYYFKIELKSNTNQTISSTNFGSQSSPITCTSAWDTVSGSFTNYGSGVRYVKIECGGDDAEYWAGNYGTFIDNTVVSVANIINANVCTGGYVFDGQYLTTTGQYVGNFVGQYGCDSNVILNLQVGPYNINDTFELCDGDTFEFDGQNYLTSTTLSGSFTSVAGCDSNVSYVVNFNTSYDDTLNEAICPGEAYDFDGQMLYTAGTYSGNFTTMTGCDSNVLLNLSLAPIDFSQVEDYFCAGSSYDFGGTTLTSPGTYTNTFQNQFGCDSTVQLTLMEDQSHEIEDAVVLCTGESLDFGSQTITESGTYSETFATQNAGCDSVVTIEVTVVDLVTSVFRGETTLASEDNNFGSTFRWLNCNQGMMPIAGAINKTYSPPLGGRYAVEITNNHCVDTSDCILYFPTGIKVPASSPVRIFPNPASDVISFQSHSAENIQEVILMDNRGRLIMQHQNIASTAFELNVTSVSPGTYMLAIQTDESTLNELIVIE